MRNEESGVRSQKTGERVHDVVSRGAWLFVAVALLLAPFAHGCHGDDVDHEPLLVPLRSNPEDR